MQLRQWIERAGQYFVDDLLYNEFAWSYDAVSWFVSLGDWQHWGRACLPFVQGVDVLEIAFGRGHLLPVLQQNGYHVTGIDLSPAMLRAAQQRVRKRGIPLLRGSVTQLPLAANSFDTVVSTFPAGFIMQAETLRGVQHVLRENGRLLIVPSAYFTERSAVHRVIDLLYAATGQHGGESAADSFAQWRTYISQFGFEVTVETVALEKSSAIVIVATKQ